MPKHTSKHTPMHTSKHVPEHMSKHLPTQMCKHMSRLAAEGRRVVDSHQRAARSRCGIRSLDLPVECACLRMEVSRAGVRCWWSEVVEVSGGGVEWRRRQVVVEVSGG